MSKDKDKNCLRDSLVRISCAFLILILCFFMASPAFADDPVQTLPPGYEDYLEQVEINNYIISYYIWLCMRAWGIQIEYNDLRNWGDDVSNLIIEWVFEYLDSVPSIHSINEWIAPWQAGYDYWGNWAGNASLLEDVQDFVDWLCEKFGITSNSTNAVEEMYTIGNNGITVYKVNTAYYSVTLGDDSGLPNNNQFRYVTQVRSDATQNEYYFCWRNTDIDISQEVDAPAVNGVYYVYFSTSVINERIQAMVYANGNWEYNFNRLVQQSNLNGSLYYWKYTDPPYSNMSRYDAYLTWIPANAVILSCSADDLNTFMQSAVLDASGVYLVTGNLQLPDNDPDYVEGDSIKIILGEPSYIEITFPDHITVDNLPSALIRPSIENPGLSGIWHYVQSWAEDTSESSQFVRYLFIDAPVPMVNLLWAILALGIIFGVVKIMRK